jgi:hypothetical protein
VNERTDTDDPRLTKSISEVAPEERTYDLRDIDEENVIQSTDDRLPLEASLHEPDIQDTLEPNRVKLRKLKDDPSVT